MFLELIPAEPNTTILTMNYTPHLLVPFAFLWTGNCILDLVTSCQNHIHEV